MRKATRINVIDLVRAIRNNNNQIGFKLIFEKEKIVILYLIKEKGELTLNLKLKLKKLN